MDDITITLHANKIDAFASLEEAIKFVEENRKEGQTVTIVERFKDVVYVMINDFKSDTTRENYFK